MRLRTSLSAISAFILIGCGNLLQATIPTSTWNEIGLNQLENSYDEPFTQYGEKYRYVTKTKGSWLFHTRWWYDVETVTPGTGPEVKPGNLVKIRLRVLSSSEKNFGQDPHEMMIYVGRTDFEDRWEAFGTTPAFGFDLGSLKIRRAIIGRRVGEHFRIQRPEHENAKYSYGEPSEFVPFKAILVKKPDWTPSYMAFVRSYEFPRDPPLSSRYLNLPYIALAGEHIEAEIEVTDICEAKLFMREARLLQAGMVFTWGGGPDTVRISDYQWVAISGKCSSDNEPIRIEAGPKYMGGQRWMGGPDSDRSVPASDMQYENLGIDGYRLKKQSDASTH